MIAQTVKSLGPFSVVVSRMPSADANVSGSTIYSVVVQLTARTSVQLLLVRFDRG